MPPQKIMMNLPNIAGRNNLPQGKLTTTAIKNMNKLVNKLDIVDEIDDSIDKQEIVSLVKWFSSHLTLTNYTLFVAANHEWRVIVEH